MADNVELNAGSSGATLAAASLTVSGDTAIVQMVGAGILSGSEGSWTHTQFVGGTGVDAAGVLRVSLATNVALPAGDNNIGNVDVVTLPADTFVADSGALGKGVLIQGWNIGGRENIAADTSGRLAVDIAANSSGSDVKVTLDDEKVNVRGDIADNGPSDVSWKPVIIGGVYDSSPATRDDGDVVGLQMTANGYAIVSVNGTVTTAGTVTEASASDIKDAVEVMEDWDESDRAKVNTIAGQAGIAANAGNMDALTTRVVVATNDTHFGTVGAASDIDGVIHGQLRYIADQLVTIDSDTNDIKTAVELLDNAVDSNYLNVNANIAGTDIVGGAGAAAAGVQRVVVATDSPGMATLGTGTYSEATTTGVVAGAVRNDDLATLANTDNEIAPLQVNSAGALYTENAQQVDYVFDAGAKVTVERASGVATDGTTAIVAATGSRKTRILALALFPTSATVTNVYLATTTDTDVLGNSGNPIPLALDADGDNIGGFVLPWNPGGWAETSTVNEALNLILSAAQDVIWAITWIKVT